MKKIVSHAVTIGFLILLFVCGGCSNRCSPCGGAGKVRHRVMGQEVVVTCPRCEGTGVPLKTH